MKGNRRLLAVLLLGLVGIATFDWLIAINVVFAVLVYDWLLETEELLDKEEELSRRRMDLIAESAYQAKKDERFKRRMEENRK